MIIDGRKIAADIIEQLRRLPSPARYLAVVDVGEGPASKSFVAQKKRVAQELNIEFRQTTVSENGPHSDLAAAILSFARDPACGGIVLQLPLPAGFDRDTAISLIPNGKDVDNLRGNAPVLAPAAGVVDEVLRASRFTIHNSRCAVVGANGFLVGRPTAAWLSSQGAEVDRLDIGDDLSSVQSADIVVLGTGEPGVVNPDMLKNGALVIDFGYGKKDDAVCGDFFPSSATSQTSSITYTPTPGGTGPILVAKLFENFYTLTGSTEK